MNAAQENRHTLGLAMIMKDEIEDLDRIVKDYGTFFDKIYITVTDKKTHTKLLKKYPRTNELVELSYFKWIDHFGKARIYNQQQVKTDYWMWIDTDDEIEGAEKIPHELEYMVANKLDVIWFRYDYTRRVTVSEPETILWRERIIRTAPNLVWDDVAVHETLDETIQGDIKEELRSKVVIKHRKTAEQADASSGLRNRLILEKEWQQTRRPVTAWYLGKDFMRLGDYNAAIEKLLFAAENSDIKPVKFRAWQYLCECYIHISDHNAAFVAIDRSIAIDPDHPAPWYQKFSLYWAMGYRNTAVYCAETAMAKRIQGNLELVSHDPSWYQYRGPFEVAKAYLSIGNTERAYQLYSEVNRIAPQYVEELSATTGVQWAPIFEKAYDSSTSTN